MAVAPPQPPGAGASAAGASAAGASQADASAAGADQADAGQADAGAAGADQADARPEAPRVDPGSAVAPLDLSPAWLERRLAAAVPPGGAQLSGARTEADGAPDARSAGGRRAAVAAVLRYVDSDPEVLLMLRASRAGDQWSGHVSLPGGREERADRDLLATAVRETREEMGVDLAATARLLGRLPAVAAGPDRKARPLWVTPFVFAIDDTPALTLNHEAAAAFWLPLRRVAVGELSGTYRFKLGPLAFERPCWRFESYVVWGLTYRMLEDLLRVAG